MNILLVNPNRYKHPPVIPLGPEYLAGALSTSKHNFESLDLCFSEYPEEDLINTLNRYQPDIAGFTIRQVDSVLYHNNEFFLPEIKNFIRLSKSHGCKTILGGAGFSIMPEEILDFTGADFGISGPGEIALVRLLDLMENNKKPPRITNGFADFRDEVFDFKRIRLCDYDGYLKNDGIVGFRTQIGCTGSCMFCTEADKKVIYHNPEMVGYEIAELKRQGYKHFHLCDSEFNLNTEHCIEVCKAIQTIAGQVKWALYMKPEPFSEELFNRLSLSGAEMLTLSVNTQNTDNNQLHLIGDFLQLAVRYGIKVAVDLSTGFPYEDISNAERIINFLDKQPVETIGVNSYYRVYPGTSLHKQIKQNKDLNRYLINADANTNLLSPTFFNFFELTTLQQLTNGKKKFRIEGFEQATNYQRLNR